ncbi:mCG1051004 [Mus musculus]|nr:mCG1051004 [Mus musculus]
MLHTDTQDHYEKLGRSPLYLLLMEMLMMAMICVAA